MKKITYHHVIDIFLLACGIFGLLGGMFNALVFPTFSIYFMILAIGLGSLWYLHEHAFLETRISLSKILLFLLLVSILYVSNWIALIENLINVFNNDYYLSFTSSFQQSNTYIIFQCICIAMISLLVTRWLLHILCHSRRVGLQGGYCLVWIAFPYLIKHHTATLYMYVSLFFILSIYLYKTSLTYLENSGAVMQTVMMVILAGILVLCHFTLESNTAFNRQVVEIFPGLPNFRQQSSHSTGSITQTNHEEMPDVKLPTGDIHLNTSKALEVQATIPFGGFLRGYSMTNYQNNSWTTETPNYITPSLNYYYQALQGDDVNSGPQVQITSLMGHEYQFTPYHVLVENMYFDSYVDTTDAPFSMYIERSDSHKYATVNDDYSRFVHTYYMDVPEETSHMLIQYLEENGYQLDTLISMPDEQKIQVIKELLTKNTTYSLTPGRLPDNRDFVEYFLNESKQGSCTHYATTGTLLLRVLGVPARFTTGYVVSSSDFKENKATVLNNRSHAWIEVFDERYGWHPIEMTPAGNDEQEQLVDVLDRLAQNPTTTPAPDSSTSNPNTSSPQTNSANPDVSKPSKSFVMMVQYGPYVIGGFLAVIGIFGQRKIRFSYKKRKYQRLSLNQRVCYGYQSAKKYMPFTKSMLSLVMKARFSQHTVTSEEVEQFEKVLQVGLQKHYQSLSWYQKWYYTFILAKR